MMVSQLENIYNEDNPFPSHSEHQGHFCKKVPPFMLHRNNAWSYLRSIKTRIKVGFASDGDG